MNEKGFKLKVQKILKNKAWAFATHDIYRSGVPDLWGSCGGRAFAIELKYSENFADGKVKLGHPLTAPQSKTLRDMKSKGGVRAYVLIGISKDEAILVDADTLEPGVTRFFEGIPMPLELALEIVIEE